VSVYRDAVRPLLFRFDPEGVHHATTALCSVAARVPTALDLIEEWYGTPADPRLATTVAGIDFPNPVGLGAGYDKNGAAVGVLSRMGFGYVDVGSVSNTPSAGNPGRPRLWRLPADRAVMVHYGVPSDGAYAVAQRFAKRPSRVPLGVTVVETNTGAANDVPAVIAEITEAIGRFRESADVVFISAACPNETSGAKPFADFDNLRRLFEAIGRYATLPPVFLKIKAEPDQIEQIVAIATPFPFLKGFLPSVAPARPYRELKTPAAELDRMPGTATGPYSKPYLLAALRNWRSRIDPKRHVLIANGGIWNGNDAYDAIRAGASLVGLVTALVYEGPGLARRINQELSALLERDGFARVADAVGLPG
jgi:dihydroorotate dehydrogenase